MSKYTQQLFNIVWKNCCKVFLLFCTYECTSLPKNTRDILFPFSLLFNQQGFFFGRSELIWKRCENYEEIVWRKINGLYSKYTIPSNSKTFQNRNRVYFMAVILKESYTFNVHHTIQRVRTLKLRKYRKIRRNCFNMRLLFRFNVCCIVWNNWK